MLIQKMKNNSWTEEEVFAATRAYFRLLEAQQRAEPVNKSQIYRQLSKVHPTRSAKAFERKLQNISAVLYELRLPYYTGLKPCHNYQKLLKTTVLEHLDTQSLPTCEPHEILYSMLKEIKNSGALKVKKKGSGRYGLAIEEALGIAQNNDKSADFMGIELKTKSVVGLQTLFSRTPSSFGVFSSKSEMFEANCYFDPKKGRKALYTSFNHFGDSLGFKLSVFENEVQILREHRLMMVYSLKRLEDALLSKLNKTVFIELKKFSVKDQEYCEIGEVNYCEGLMATNFLRLVEAGNIYLDLTLSMDTNGTIRDHGFLWRIQSSAIENLYKKTQLLPL
jgi:hypothetical protein